MTHGAARTLREFSAGFFMTACCESTGVLSGAYVYPGFHWYVLATPVANPASWIATVYIIIEVTNRIVYGRRSFETYERDGGQLDTERFRLFRGSFFKTLVCLALIDALLALVVDVVMDPLATVYNWWVWVPYLPDVTSIGPGVVDAYNFDNLRFLTTPENPVHDFFAGFFPHGLRYPTRVLGIPLINFIAWFVFVFTFTIEFRYVEFKNHWSQWRKTAVLWALVLLDIPILALLLIVPNI
ncbi:MAG: carotenoid biosynthesis protein [Candidatus Alcyoniella australis]|nr:carotenoid biosynthesis protein [Candidatus Alcyoniella australis]